MSKVLVTGSSGFIGKGLVSVLGGDGFSVQTFDVRNKSEQDILDASTLSSCIKTLRPEVIVHLAANSNPTMSWDKPDVDLSLNSIGTLNLLAAMRGMPGCHIVFASTALVYGPARYLPIDEQHPLDPTSPYAASKLSAENYIRVFSKKIGYRYTILRFFNTIGPGQALGFVVPDVTKKVVETSPEGTLTIRGSPDDSRDFLALDDLVDALVRVVNTDPENLTINLGSGSETTMKELATDIQDVLGKHLAQVRFENNQSTPSRFCANIALAKEKLKWEPRTDFKSALEKTVRWVLENLLVVPAKLTS